MTTAITATPEKRRRMNPNSLANLKPFTKGVSGNPEGKAHQGPMLTPAIRRMLEMPVADLERLYDKIIQDPRNITGVEAIAITTVMDALTTGAFSTGIKSREQIIQRVDVPHDKSVEVSVGVVVNLKWNDGE